MDIYIYIHITVKDSFSKLIDAKTKTAQSMLKSHMNIWLSFQGASLGGQTFRDPKNTPKTQLICNLLPYSMVLSQNHRIWLTQMLEHFAPSGSPKANHT